MPPQLPSNRPADIQHIRKNSQLLPSAHNVSSPFHSGLFCWRVSAENTETCLSPPASRLSGGNYEARFGQRRKKRSSRSPREHAEGSCRVAIVKQNSNFFIINRDQVDSRSRSQNKCKYSRQLFPLDAVKSISSDACV